MSFTALTTDAQWDDLLQTSETDPVIIFKHSNACGGSSEAELKLSTADEQGSFPVTIHRLVVQKSRELSNRIADELHVRHHTPQVIVMRHSKSIYDADHSAIEPAIILKHLS
jgi:bacillithiol system protein YtxJ